MRGERFCQALGFRMTCSLVVEIYSYPLLNEDAEVSQVIEVRRDITGRP